MAYILVHFPGVGAVSPTIPTKKIETTNTTPPIQPANAIGSGSSPPTTSGGVAVVAPRVVTNTDHLGWVDPVLANTLMQDFANSDPVSRDRLGDIPIALSEPVSTETLFQSAQDSNRYFFLYSFQVRGSDGERVAVQFGPAPGGTGWRLDVKLEEFKSPKLHPPPLSELHALDPTPTRVYLSYETPYGIAPPREFQSFLPETIEGKPGYQLSMPIDTIALRDDIFLAMTTPASKCQIVVVRQQRFAVSDGDAQYRIESPMIPFSVAPFCFPYEAHHGPGDVYSFVPSVAESGSALRPVQASYLGTKYDYFQDPVDSTHFYYLPDAFKLCRRPSSPHYPCITISVDGDSLETAQVTATYVAQPVIDQGRLDAAQNADELKKWANGPILALDPLPAQEPILNLSSSGADEARPQAHVNIATGIRDTITKPLGEFRRVFDALLTDSSDLFKGYVKVKLGADLGYEIPFAARIGDMVGPVFEQTTTLQDASTILVTLRNAIEGSIKLLSPPAASVLVNSNKIDCKVWTPTPAPSFPVELKPADDGLKAADQLQLVVAASAPLVDGKYQLVVNTDHRVTSSGQAVLDAVLDPVVESKLTRTVTVKIPPGVFSVHSPGSAAQLVAIQLTFEDGTSATFEAPKSPPTDPLLTQVATISPSIIDYLLSRADDSSYRYRVRWIYSDGRRVQDKEWRTDTSSPLFPDVTAPVDSAHG